MKTIPGLRYLAILVTLVCVVLNVMILQSRQAAPLGDLGEDFPNFESEELVNEQASAESQDDPLKPEFYRGIYLHNYSARTTRVLAEYVARAKEHGVNTLVLDLQDAVYFRRGEIPAENLKLCQTNGIWPVARIVVFPYGLKEYPVPEALIEERLELAREAVRLGFKEIQFDYIRFEDSGRLAHIGQAERYQLVEGFLARARDEFKPQGVLVTADVFGRVALNREDPIGQKLEGLDRVVDVILPMAYPSHYTWSSHLIANPYYTLHQSSVEAKARLTQARLVMYIQGFEMRVAASGLTLPVYIAHQMQACQDAGSDGWIVWNAAQAYGPTWEALRLLSSGEALPGLEAAQEARRRELKKSEQAQDQSGTKPTKTRA